MKSIYTKLSLAVVLTIVLQSLASAQGGWTVCIDPTNKNPISPGAIWYIIQDQLFSAALGATGTVTYGGSDATAQCFNPAVTANINGRVGFGVGFTGSNQSGFDDNMALTFGWPIPAGNWDAADISEDGKLTLVGASGNTIAFNGASDRYAFIEQPVGTNLDLQERVDVIGDVSRIDYKITNNDTVAHGIGLWYGAWIALLTGNNSNQAGGPPLLPGEKDVYISAPGYKPIITERRMFAPSVPYSAQFPLPAAVDFDYGQQTSYGLQVIMGPSPLTEDQNGLNSDATQVDEFGIGNPVFLIPSPTAGDGTFPNVMFGGNKLTITEPSGTVLTEDAAGDVNLGSPGFLQKYYEQTVAPGTTREIVSYYRGTWGTANYAKPYSVVLDAPPTMGTDISDPNLAQPAGGYDIRIWVDNTRGFSTVDKTISMQDVAITLSLPKGINLVPGDNPTKVIPFVTPASPNINFVDFHVLPDGTAFGALNYSVTVVPNPGTTKTVTGTINVPATPVLTLNQGLNLVSTPFTFSDTSWEAILGLSTPQQFQAFNYDPIQAAYTPGTSEVRGQGSWIYSPTTQTVKLQSNPQTPSDMFSTNGTLSINLQPGWNLIADPYPYQIPLGSLVGVSNQNATQSYAWQDLVSQGYVNGAIAFYDPTSATGYSYIQQNTDLMTPNTGYWIYVNGNSILTLNYPTVDQEFTQGSNRSGSTPWTQTATNWRLQLVARNSASADAQNYVGVVASQQKVQQLQILKPPTLPTKGNNVNLAIEGTANGRSMSLAQALSTSIVNKSYTVDVSASQDGPVTITWPNISTVPHNLRFTLVDTATGVTRSMNQSSGYTFTANANTTRQLKVEVSSGSAGAATIGNVVVTRPSRAPDAPFTIVYSLASAATTSVRILSPSGQTVYNVTSGRADAIGTNSVSWNLRDNANRSVAPGIYRVEITADTADGQRVRKIVTINVIR